MYAFYVAGKVVGGTQKTYPHLHLLSSMGPKKRSGVCVCGGGGGVAKNISTSSLVVLHGAKKWSG